MSKHFDGKLLVGGRLQPGRLVVQQGTIVAVELGELGERAPSPQGISAPVIAPGFVDLQINGAFGFNADDSAEALRGLCRRLPETGVTSFLPTLVTQPQDRYAALFRHYETARGAPGAQMLGLHLEGPYLAPSRAGAHRTEAVRAGLQVPLEELLEPGWMVMMTLAPELPGNDARLRQLTQAGVCVSVGHTDATATQISQACNQGARMATHLFNAMSAFSHRSPGAAGAILVDDRICAGIIADGIHCHPQALQLAKRAKGASRLALVTDAMSAAGMGPGQYKLGGQTVLVDQNSARLEDGTLAGSLLTLDAAVRNAVAWGGFTLAEALQSASEVPAQGLRLSGFKKGILAKGFDADLVLLSDSLEVQATYVAGERVWGSHGNLE